jgi:hypothetical protein
MHRINRGSLGGSLGRVLLGAIALAILGGCQFTRLLAEPQTIPLAQSKLLRQVADIPLPGDTSRFDYQSLDQRSGYLYIAHLGAGHVLVLNFSGWQWPRCISV